MRTILTILLTSLVWSFVIVAFFEPRSKSAEADQAVTTQVVDMTPTPAPTRKEKRAERKVEKQTAKKTKKQAEKQTAEPTKLLSEEAVVAEAVVTEEIVAEAVAPETITAEEVISEEVVAEAAPAPVTERIDYAREIDGKWTPVEGAEYPLEFTKYNVAIQHKGYQKRINYSLNGKSLRINYDNARCEINKQGGEYYLEIYKSQDYSGKYRRTSQPLKIAMRQIDESLYGDAIVGKWSVINGQEYPIEFSKYGTAIQDKGYEKRIEYSINGSQLKINYDNARVVISEDASYYYLEIYNSQDFSGRYRKSK